MYLFQFVQNITGEGAFKQTDTFVDSLTNNGGI